MLITVKMLRSLDVCHRYCRADGRTPSVRKIKAGLGGKSAVTVAEFCDLSIPEADRIWVLAQPGIIPKQLLRDVLLKYIVEAFHGPTLSDEAKKWFAVWEAQGFCKAMYPKTWYLCPSMSSPEYNLRDAVAYFISWDTLQSGSAWMVLSNLNEAWFLWKREVWPEILNDIAKGKGT